MKKSTLTKVLSAIAELEKKYSFADYLINYIDQEHLKSLDSVDDVIDYIRWLDDDTHFTDGEIIWYYKATEYLLKNDPSLKYSMELASGYGYSLENLNSEVLASLLFTDNNKDDFNTFLELLKNEIEDLF